MKWYILRWKRTFDFSGRSRRTEYWMSFLFDIIILFALVMIDNILGLDSILPTIYGIALIVPNVSCTVRRIHDIGKSGLYYLLQVPYMMLSQLEGCNWGIVKMINDSPFYILFYLASVGLLLVVFTFTLIDGQVGDNIYGKDPKELERIEEHI